MRQLIGRVLGAVALLTLVALVTGCRSGGGGSSAPGADPSRPIALSAGHGGAPQVVVPIDRELAARSIENYRINKKRKKGSYKLQGVDLDGDGVGELLVLFEGQDWCKTTGCSLAIFKSSEHGYKVAFRTVSVKPPVIVAREDNQGWRDIIVSSGGGRSPMRRVLLRFSGIGYPRNAMLEPEVRSDRPIDGEVAFNARAPRPSQASSARVP